MRGDFGPARITLFTLVKSANVWEWALRVNATPYERLNCERLSGLREIVIGPCLIGPCGVPSPTRSFANKSSTATAMGRGWTRYRTGTTAASTPYGMP